MASAHTKPNADLDTLIGLFYADRRRLGEFQPVDAHAVPGVYRQLLDHNHHMTVTVEEFHGEPVNVDVLEAQQNARHYWRRIVLRRQSDGEIVLFGIVRLDLTLLSEPVRREIQSRRTPLGRILIQHNVLREVELLELFRITLGPELRRLMPDRAGDTTHGRTALIHCNGEPAVELLEIVAPVGDG